MGHAPGCPVLGTGGTPALKGVQSPLWGEGYRMGIPRDGGAPSLLPNLGATAMTLLLSQNCQILGGLCVRLSCVTVGWSWGLTAGQSRVPPPLPVGQALTSLCSCLCSHETSATCSELMPRLEAPRSEGLAAH